MVKINYCLYWCKESLHQFDTYKEEASDFNLIYVDAHSLELPQGNGHKSLVIPVLILHSCTLHSPQPPIPPNPVTATAFIVMSFPPTSYMTKPSEGVALDYISDSTVPSFTFNRHNKPSGYTLIGPIMLRDKYYKLYHQSF